MIIARERLNTLASLNAPLTPYAERTKFIQFTLYRSSTIPELWIFKGHSGTFLLQTARELGVVIVAYSPLGRGILTGQYKSVDNFDPDDYRRVVPRYQGEKESGTG